MPEPVEWKIVGSRLVFDHPVLALVEDTVELPDGTSEQWLRYADDREGRRVGVAAGALCRSADGRFLVSRQWCLGPRRVVHELPGGGVAPGESLQDAVRRELQEEVGLYPRQLEYLGGVLYENRRSASKIHVFLASELEERALPSDPSEVIATAWFTAAEIDTAIADGTFEHAFLLAAWAMYGARYHPC